MFLFWSMCMALAGIVGWWWKGRRIANHVCMERPASLTPWIKPDHDEDRPPRNYVTVRCPDPACNATVDLPIKRIKINHSTVGISVSVETQTEDLSLHEMGHSWS